MVVSTSPSVAAGVPSDKTKKGHLCGFLGQVPVRVHGPIHSGDFLVPSGLNDGRARAGGGWHSERYEPLGTSMDNAPEGEHLVLAFVRWEHTGKWDAFKMDVAGVRNNKNIVWPFSFFVFCVFFITRSRYDREDCGHSFCSALMYHSNLDLMAGIWAAFHCPEYSEFVFESKYYIVNSLVHIALCVFAMRDILTRDGGPMTQTQVSSMLTELIYLFLDMVCCLGLACVYWALRVHMLKLQAASKPSLVPQATDFQKRVAKIKGLFGFGEKED